HKTTKRYMPVEKSSASKKPERQISTGHRWVPTGKLLNSCTGKVENEPTHGSNVDIPHIHACKQTLGLSAETSARMVSQKMKFQMMSDHNSSDLAPQRQEMASTENNTSGPVPQCSKDVCSQQIKPRSLWQ
ncbi:hypothetical protein Tco_0263499, partial [Tanacetum coccineum]